MNVGILTLFLLWAAMYSLVLGVAQIVASRRLSRLRGRGGVNAAAVLSLLPLYPLVVLGAPIAIWMLIFANGKKARQAFELVAFQSGSHAVKPGSVPPIAR